MVVSGKKAAPRVSAQCLQNQLRVSFSGSVMPVKDHVVKVDPKRLHRTVPRSGGAKWTGIAHTIGGIQKLKEEELEGLEGLGFLVPHAAWSPMRVTGK